MNAEKIVICSTCGQEENFKNVIGWRAELSDNKITDLYCLDCSAQAAKSNKLVDFKFSELQVKLPMRGKFRPVKSEHEFEKVRGTYMNTEGWTEFESQIGFLLTSQKQKLERIEVENHYGLEGFNISFVWTDSKVRGISFPGDSISSGLELDIYQEHRLREMGLTEFGDQQKTWQIQLEDPENNPVNLARIVCHVLEFGYFMKHHKIYSMNMTVN